MYIRKALRPLLAAIANDDDGPRTPGRLLAEAQLGLRLIEPKGLGWFPFDGLPPCHWHSGELVRRDILCWWVVLAWYGKQPEGTPLLQKYLAFLEERSQEALGLFILQTFLRHDTQGLGWPDTSPQGLAQLPPLPLQQPQQGEADEPLLAPDHPVRQGDPVRWRERLGHHAECTALDAKGVLALAAGTAEATLVARVLTYFREYPSRWAQQRCLLLLLSASGTRSALQFLAATAQRHPAPTVQGCAAALVDQLARSRGWTEEDLADRTIPDAGLDAAGMLLLDYGPRRFQATLEATQKLQLRDATGRAIQALPSPNKGDAPLAVMEAKRALSECRKTIRTVGSMWKVRLREYLRTQKAWPIQEWLDWPLANPIVGRLLQRLVWMDEQGQTFRPAAAGGLVNVNNEAIPFPTCQVHLAHASLLAPKVAQAWLDHGAQLGIDWLFNQLDHVPPCLWLIGATDMRAINDRAGARVDALAFFGILKRLGYVRGGFSEGPAFNSMVKIYPRLKIQVEIEFSGAFIPTCHGWAALKSLHFTDLRTSKRLTLQQVPLVLLAESYADYQTVAQKGSG